MLQPRDNADYLTGWEITMKKIAGLCLCVALFTGCAAVYTPTSSSVPIDSAEIAKSTLLGENCMNWFFGLGPFGDASIKSIMDSNPGKKVTLVDHKTGWYLVASDYCIKVYGY